MPQRKGQFIINHFRFTLKIPEADIGRVMFNLLDEELDKIEREYRAYVIKEIHKPERQARQEDIDMLMDNIKKIGDRDLR